MAAMALMPRGAVLWAVLWAHVLLLCWSACAYAQPLVISDDLGRTLNLAAPARRVVVLGDFCAELVCALQAGDTLIGRARWVSWPPQVAALPHLGLQAQPNIGLLLKWRPDLILADAHLRQALPLLEKLKLPVLVYQGRDMAAIKHAINSLALALGRVEQGGRLLAFVREIQDILQARQLAPVPLFLAFSQHGPPYYDILSLRPLLALAGISGYLPAGGGVNPEWLLRHKPEIAVLTLWRPNGAASLSQSWRALRARAEFKGIAKLYVMDSRLVYNLQAVVGLLYLAKIAHPQAMAGVEPWAYHQRLWQEFFNLPLNEALVYD